MIEIPMGGEGKSQIMGNEVRDHLKHKTKAVFFAKSIVQQSDKSFRQKQQKANNHGCGQRFEDLAEYISHGNECFHCGVLPFVLFPDGFQICHQSVALCFT